MTALDLLIKAHRTLGDALKNVKDLLDRDGAIQRFEYTYELFWKTLQKKLREHGVEANSPRSTFRESAKQGFIKDPSYWFKIIEMRNLTVHIYNEEIAEKIFAELPHIFKNMAAVIKVLQDDSLL